MLPVSATFHASEKADINLPVAKVQLMVNSILQTSTFTATSTFSSDYPASGVHDGDRTELNIGPATGADNSRGQSSWRSANTPTGGSPEYVQFNMNASVPQSISSNRVKVYWLSGHAPKKVVIAFHYEGDPALTWHDVFASQDLNPLGGFSGTYFDLKGTVDTFDFPLAFVNGIRVKAFDVAVPGDKLNVVEVEAYRVWDVTGHLLSLELDRQRDYKLAQPMAAACKFSLTDWDKQFSPSYGPTGDERGLGFVNNLLVPGRMSAIVSLGYNYAGTSEYAQVFVGSIDKISVDSRNKITSFECRDNMKLVLNRLINSNLKTSIDLGYDPGTGIGAVQYVLNLCNFSTFEMAVDKTTITIDNFFTEDASAFTVLQNLVQAAGDAIFYFDENGQPVFKAFLNSIPQNFTWTAESDFEAAGGVLTNVESTGFPDSIRRKWFLVDDFANQTTYPTNYSQNPTWWLSKEPGSVPVYFSLPSDVYTLDTGRMKVAMGSNGSTKTVCFAALPYYGTVTPLSGVVDSGTFQADISIDTNSFSEKIRIWFAMAGGPFPSHTDPPPGHDTAANQGYYVEIVRGTTNNVIFYKQARGPGAPPISDPSRTQLTAASVTISGSTFTARWTVNAATGTYSFYINGSLIFTVTDTTYTTWISPYGNGKWWGFSFHGTSGATFHVDNVYRTNKTLDGSSTATNTQAIYESPKLDMSVAMQSLGLFVATTSEFNEFGNGSNNNITFYTSTSPNGTVWDPYVIVANGGQIMSTPQRYIKWKAVFRASADGGWNNDVNTPIVFDATINWNTGAGSVKYPAGASFTFRFDSNIMDLTQESSDSLGGDTSILNDIFVQASPLILQGSNSDIVWQGLTGVPPAPIGGGNTLHMTAGQDLLFQVLIPGGMDTSRMSGGSPAAVNFSSSSGSFSYSFTYINPTHPILKVHCTTAGDITNLQIAGKTFKTSTYFTLQEAFDQASIASYGIRQVSISSPYIINNGIAAAIASLIVARSKDPTFYISKLIVRPTFSLQLGDRITIVDVGTYGSSAIGLPYENNFRIIGPGTTNINGDYLVSGIRHVYSGNQVYTEIIPLFIS